MPLAFLARIPLSRGTSKQEKFLHTTEIPKVTTALLFEKPAVLGLPLRVSYLSWHRLPEPLRRCILDCLVCHEKPYQDPGK